MKRIMILGAGQMQIPLIQKCNALGYVTVVTDMDKNAAGLKLADIPLVINTIDKSKTLEAFKKYKCASILTTSDYPVKTTAYINEKLHLPGVSTLAANLCTNKLAMREALSKNSLKSPKYWGIQCTGDLELFQHQEVFPLIVKPTDSSASRGVTLVDNIKELKAAYEEALQFSKNGVVIIEEYIKGNEYSIESLTQNGKTTIVAITEKKTSEAPYFVEESHIIPASLPNELKQKISQFVRYTIASLNIDDTATHTEIKIYNEEIYLIEIGCRLGGDYITSHLVPLSTGIDMIENIINISLGLPINIEATKSNHSKVIFLNANNYSQLAGKVICENGIIKDYHVGEYSKDSIKDSSQRLGYIIMSSPRREDLEKFYY